MDFRGFFIGFCWVLYSVLYGVYSVCLCFFLFKGSFSRRFTWNTIMCTSTFRLGCLLVVFEHRKASKKRPLEGLGTYVSVLVGIMFWCFFLGFWTANPGWRAETCGMAKWVKTSWGTFLGMRKSSFCRFLLRNRQNPGF